MSLVAIKMERGGRASINRWVDLWPADDRKNRLSWGMPLLFSIQGGNEFLVIFQKCCPWAQADPVQGSKTQRGRRVGWCGDEHFHAGRVDVASNRMRWIELRCASIFGTSKYALCRHLMSPCWSAMKKSHRLILNMWQLSAELIFWCLQPNLDLIYAGRKQVLHVLSSHWRFI